MGSNRDRIGQVLTDYRDGLLDSLEDAVDAIESIVRATDGLRVDVTTMDDAERRFEEVEPPVSHKPPNLGHRISTRDFEL